MERSELWGWELESRALKYERVWHVCVYAVCVCSLRVWPAIQKQRCPPAAGFVRAAFYFLFQESHAKDILKVKKYM